MMKDQQGMETTEQALGTVKQTVKVESIEE